MNLYSVNTTLCNTARHLMRTPTHRYYAGPTSSYYADFFSFILLHWSNLRFILFCFPVIGHKIHCYKYCISPHAQSLTKFNITTHCALNESIVVEYLPRYYEPFSYFRYHCVKTLAKFGPSLKRPLFLTPC